MIENGSKVTIEYSLYLDNGELVSGTTDGEPLTYEQGRGDILPALESALAGLNENESKEVRLTPDEGFGAVDPNKFQSVAADAVPEEARKSGAQLVATDDQENQQLVRVHEVQDDRIVLDLNHPLAGEPLTFKVRVVEID